MSKSGTFYYGDNGSVELDTGWYKGWTCENVYGWEFHGRVDEWPRGGKFVDMVVLHYEPNRAERLQIQERFKDAIAPDGTKGLTYPQ